MRQPAAIHVALHGWSASSNASGSRFQPPLENPTTCTLAGSIGSTLFMCSAMRLTAWMSGADHVWSVDLGAQMTYPRPVHSRSEPAMPVAVPPAPCRITTIDAGLSLDSSRGRSSSTVSPSMTGEERPGG